MALTRRQKVWLGVLTGSVGMAIYLHQWIAACTLITGFFLGLALSRFKRH